MKHEPIYFAPTPKLGGGYVCHKDSPSPPPAPDYAGAAVAQGAANKDAAIASSRLNNPNVNSVYGTQTWTEGEGPRVFNQSAYDTALKSYSDLMTQGGRWENSDVEGGPARWVAPVGVNAPNVEDFYTRGEGDGRPTLTQTLSPEQQSLYEKSIQTKGLLGDLGIQGADALKGVVGRDFDLSGAPSQPGSYDSTRQRVFDAQMARTNEDYKKSTDNLNSDLVARGIMPGNKAYADAQQMIERSRNDARNQAEITAGNAASQAFSMDSQRRKDAIAEILAQRQTPLNEINALMSGSQVSNPFAVPGASQGSNIAPAPIFGATQALDQYNTGVYNAQQGSANSFQNGLFGLGAAAIRGGLFPGRAF